MPKQVIELQLNVVEQIAAAEKALTNAKDTKEFWTIVLPLVDFYEPSPLTDWPQKLRSLIERGLERDRRNYILPEES